MSQLDVLIQNLQKEYEDISIRQSHEIARLEKNVSLAAKKIADRESLYQDAIDAIKEKESSELNKQADSQSNFDLEFQRKKTEISERCERNIRLERERLDQEVRGKRIALEEKIERLRRSVQDEQSSIDENEKKLRNIIDHYRGNIPTIQQSILNLETELYRIRYYPAKETTDLHILEVQKNLDNSKEELFNDLFELEKTAEKLEMFLQARGDDSGTSVNERIETMRNAFSVECQELKNKFSTRKTELIEQRDCELMELESQHKKNVSEMELRSAKINDDTQKQLAELEKQYIREKKLLENALAVCQEEMESIKDRFALEMNRFLMQAKSQLDPYFVMPEYNPISSDLSSLSIPNSICIGCIPQVTPYFSLIERIYNRKSMDVFSPINIDVRKSENLIIKASPKSLSNESLYKCVCGLTLRYLEEFPLGKLSLTLIDTLSDRSVATIARSFQQARSEKGKMIAKTGLISSIEGAVSAFNNISQSVERIFNKLNKYVDLHELAQIDDTEVFNLIVIRNGFKEIVNRPDVLTLLVSFAKKSECGVRLIIIDDTENAQSVDEQRDILIKQIEDSAIKITFRDDAFWYNNELAKLSTFSSENWIQQIDSETKRMANILDTNSDKLVSYEDLGFGKSFATAEETIDIPIGLSAGMPYTLSLGCGGTGTNIGCMVLGRSGYGKSSVFHAVVINGAMKYSPEDLTFWLLDFKSGAASSAYINAHIPHISIVAANNSTEDAYSLLKLLDSELETRQSKFNEYGTSDIAAYNRVISKNSKGADKRMPRIVVVIDEAQDLIPPTGLDDADYANEIKNLIASVANKGRNKGVHIVMCAQNFQNGKAYELIDNFLGQINARISFNIESGYADNLGLSFKSSQEEILALPKLTAMASSDGGSGTLTKFSVGVSRVKDDFEHYFKQIRERYKSTKKTKTAIIGDISQLHPYSIVHNRPNVTYLELINETASSSGFNNFNMVFGEDYYSLEPLSFRFNDENVSGCVIVGNNSKIGISILLSTLYGSLQSGYGCWCYDGMVKANLFKRFITKKPNINAFNSIIEILTAAYLEMGERKKVFEKNPEAELQPLMLFLNNICSSHVDELDSTPGDSTSRDLSSSNTIEDNEGIRIPVGSNLRNNEVISSDMSALSILEAIIEQGPEVRIYVNLSIPKADYKYQNLFNSTNMVACERVNPIDGLNTNELYRVKIHLKAISELTYPTGHPKQLSILDPSDHPFAVFIRNSQVYRVRPVIWSEKDLKMIGEK